MDFLTGTDVEFHTFIMHKEKSYRLVLRGLPTIDARKVEEELEREYEVITITSSMTQKEPNNFPPLLFSVKTVDNVKKLNQIKIIDEIKVKWEAYKLSGQCFNCQQFGRTS